MTSRVLRLLPATTGAHARGEHRMGPVRVARARRLLPSLRLILILVGLFAAAAAAAVEPVSRLPGLRGDFGAGFGELDTSAAPYGDSGGAVRVDLTVGARVSDHRLVGVNLSGGGSQINDRNDTSAAAPFGSISP